MRLTGRLTAAPDDFVRPEFLEPQFRHEVANQLHWYVLIEKALLLEYHRLGILSADQVTRIAVALDGLTAAELTAGADAALSDIALSMEAGVARAPPREDDHFGGFSLANELTLRAGIPWRTAQVVAGRCVTAVLDEGRDRAGIGSPEALGAAAREAGYPLEDPASYLENVVDVDAQLRSKVSAGSTSPASVVALLAEQRERLDAMAVEWDSRRAAVQAAIATTAAAVRPVTSGVG